MIFQQNKVSHLLEDFKSRLKNHFGNRFSGLILFGSYAKNQARHDSDIDLLLVLKNHSTIKDDYILVLPLISGFLLETGFFISLVIKSEQELIHQKEGLLKNIEAEGTPI
jgi:predicted nucleotidyltransferase